MSTDLQQIASRTNGAKSHGPITDDGRQASSQNSRTHGLLAKKVVLAGESQEEFDALLASFLDEHQPETATERDLIERMAIARWRQERVWSVETAGLNNAIRHPRYHEGEDYETQTFVAFRTLSDDSSVLDLLNRYEARFERQFRAALTALLTLRAKRRAEERADARAEAETSTTNVRVFWDDTDNKDDKEDNPDPVPAPSGSFGSPQSPAPFHSLQALYRRLSAFIQAPKSAPCLTLIGDRIS